MSSLEIQDVTYTYPDAAERALNGARLDVRPGELMCLVGPSGCGKTTLLKIVSGLLNPDTGTIRFAGSDVSRVPPEHRRAVMVFQNHLLFPFMSVMDNLAFSLKMQGVPSSVRRERARQMLHRLRLEDYGERRPTSLSAGQQQRVALGRALVAEPAVLLLDEPLSNLDRHLREDMRQAIIELQRESAVTTICVTHDQEEAVLLADRIAMLSAGRVVQIGTAEDFYERPATVAIGSFFGNHNHLDGVLRGSTVVSSLGTLRINRRVAARCADGDSVCIHVRPESIEMRAPCSGQPNCIGGTVTHRVYVGTHVRYSVDVAGKSWQIVMSPVAPGFQEGSTVSLHLPEDRIWLTGE